MESLGGTVGFVTALAGATRNPIFAMPEFCMARTSIGIERFCDATAPGVGEIKMTWSACTFDRKMESVSSAKLPAPSVARPTIVMLPPAPEFDGNVIERPTEYVLTWPMKLVSSVPMSPPLNVRFTLFNARLSTADTLKRRPPAIACVSPAAFVSVMAGGVTSRWMPPMLRAVSHAQTASASALALNSAVPRLIRTSRIATLSCCLPGLLAARRDEIVDDVRRDQNQQIAPVLRLGREAEQLAQNRQIYKEGNSGLRYRDLSHRKSANYGRFAVADQDLIVRLLRLEREPDVHGCRAHVRALRVHFHQDLPRPRHVRRHAEIDTGLLELHRRTRHVGTASTRTTADGAHIDDANWHAVADEDLGLPVIERRDRRLGLDVGEVDPLQRLHERRQVEVAEGGRENQVERRVDDLLGRIAERRQGIAAQRHDVLVGREIRLRDERVGHAVQIGIDRFRRARIGTLNELVEELCGRAEVVFDAHLLDVGAIDEDDLRLDRHLWRALVEALHELHDLVDARADLGDHERVARRVGDRLTALGQNRCDRRDQGRRLRVVDAHQARRDGHGGIGAGQLFLVHDVENPAGQVLPRETLRLEHRVEREIPRLILDLGGDVALDVLAEDDRAPAERREARDHVLDARVVPLDRDARRLRLRGLGAMRRQILIDRPPPAQ